MSRSPEAPGLKERLSGPPSRRAAYYTLAQASYACLAGSFEMPMACRLAGRIDFVAALYAWQFVALFAGFALGMALLRGGRASALFRAGIAVWGCLAFSVVILFPRIQGVGALAAYFLLRGLGDGFYWSARHRSFMWTVSDSGRDSFALRLQSVVVALSVVLPLVGGLAITFAGGGASAYRADSVPASALAQAPALPAGYRTVFLVAGSFMLLALLFSPSLRIGESSLSFRSVFGVLRLREARRWFASICVGGVAGGMLMVASGIQAFGILKTEFKVGGLGASVALLSGVSFLALGELASKRKGMRLKGAFIGSVADFASRCIFALAPTTAGLVAKSLIDAIFVPLKNMMGENVVFALISRLARAKGEASRCGPGRPAEPSRPAATTAELYVFRELFLEAARIVGCALAGLAFLAILRSGALDAPRLASRVLIGAAAPVALVDFLFVRSFARANAEAPSFGRSN